MSKKGIARAVQKCGDISNHFSALRSIFRTDRHYMTGGLRNLTTIGT
jgi:hypothetical protein